MTHRPPPATPARRQVLGTALALGAAARLASFAPASSAQPGSPAMTPRIDVQDPLTTLVNVFSLAPEDRDALVALLKEGTVAWISKVPGFVSSSLHVSRDGRRIVIYSQWRSADAIAAMRQRPEMPAYFARVQALSQAEAMTCDLVSTVMA
jgi:quinol monooxygenase YgiN